MVLPVSGDEQSPWMTPTLEEAPLLMFVVPLCDEIMSIPGFFNPPTS
jgi:hypothetical protein